MTRCASCGAAAAAAAQAEESTNRSSTRTLPSVFDAARTDSLTHRRYRLIWGQPHSSSATQVCQLLRLYRRGSGCRHFSRGPSETTARPVIGHALLYSCPGHVCGIALHTVPGAGSIMEALGKMKPLVVVVNDALMGESPNAA